MNHPKTPTNTSSLTPPPPPRRPRRKRLRPSPARRGKYHPAPVPPSFASYIGGCLATIGIVSALGLGGYWLRRWIVPEFSGPLARLADITIAVALLVMALQLLGSLSILTLGWTVVVCIATGLGAAALGWWMAPAESREVAAPQVQTYALLIALGGASS